MIVDIKAKLKSKLAYEKVKEVIDELSYRLETGYTTLGIKLTDEQLREHVASIKTLEDMIDKKLIDLKKEEYNE